MALTRSTLPDRGDRRRRSQSQTAVGARPRLSRPTAGLRSSPAAVQGARLFDRANASLAEALVSALRDVEAAGLTVGSVRSEDLVTLREIAARTGRSYEGVRLLAAGKRGPGGFPGPMSSAGWTLYSWAQAWPWFSRPAPSSPLGQEPLTLERDRLIAAADHLVRARALMRGDHLADGLAALVSA